MGSIKYGSAQVFHYLGVVLVLVFATELFARGYQHLFWDAPYRTLFWSESLFRPIVEHVLGVEWSEYVRNQRTDRTISIFIKVLGIVYVILGLLVLKWLRGQKAGFWISMLATILMFFLAWSYTKENFYHIAQFFEYSLQMSIPLLAYWYIRYNGWSKQTVLFVKIVIALTFLSHGMYALGWYPRPGNFIEMTTSILGIGEHRALLFLEIVGYLDFVVAIGVFLPWRIARWIVLYAGFWGLLTALARIWSHFYIDYLISNLHRWTWESVVRLGHGLIPLVLYYYVNESAIEKNPT